MLVHAQAAQLEQASTTKMGRSSPLLPLSAPPSSTLTSPASAASSSPSTPAEPWLDDTPLLRNGSSSDEGALGSGWGLGLSGAGLAPRKPLEPLGGPPKLVGRAAISKSRPEDEEETDDDLEDELNDFGYGTTRRKEKKESLLDMLNSDPPDWMVENEPVPVSVPKRHATLQKKIRSKLSSTPLEDDPHAGFTTLRRRGSKNTSPLRATRSAGNLLTNFRNRTNTLTSRISGGDRSHDDLALPGTAPPIPSSFSQEQVGDDDDAFTRSLGPPSAPTRTLSAAPMRKLSAKEATSTATTTRELAEFLRTSEPPLSVSSSNTSLANTEASSLRSHSTSGRGHARSNRSLKDSEGNSSIDATGSMNSNGAGGTAIMRAAMVKFGGVGRRRASLGSAAAFQDTLPQPVTASSLKRPSTANALQKPSTGIFSQRPSTATPLQRPSTGMSFQRPSTATPLQRPSTANPLQRPSTGISYQRPSTANPLQRPSTGTSAISDEYDPQGAETILVDESLVRGMFGTPRRREEPREAQLGVYEFVELDEREFGSQKPVPQRLGSLPRSTAMPTISDAAAGSPLLRKGSLGSAVSHSSSTKMASPRRKPVPLISTNTSESISGSVSPSNSSTSRPFVKDHALAALMRLQDRDDTSPLAVGESPIKGFNAAPAQEVLAQGSPLPFSTLVPRPEDASPVSSTNEPYSTPPVTPTPPAATDVPALYFKSKAKTGRPATAPASGPTKRLSLIANGSGIPRGLSPVTGASYRAERPTSPPPDTPLPSLPSSSSDDTTSIGVRPGSIVLQLAEPSAKRLSMLQVSEEPPLTNSITGRPPVDSPLDPPLSEAAPSTTADAGTRVGLRDSLDLDDSLLLALDCLRSCMEATVDLPLDLPKLRQGRRHGQDDAPDSRETVAALLPTLKGMQQSMEYGAKLLGALLARIEGDEKAEGESERAKRELDEGAVAEALLGGGEMYESPEGERGFHAGGDGNERPKANEEGKEGAKEETITKVVVAGEDDSEEPAADDDFPLLVVNIKGTSA
ncbi:hypothetical protein JCM5296_002140 [Sporobolomyces johnsonii]